MTYPNRAHNPAPALDLLSCGRQIAEWMVEALENHDKPEVLERIRGDVKVLTDAFPLY